MYVSISISDDYSDEVVNPTESLEWDKFGEKFSIHSKEFASVTYLYTSNYRRFLFDWLITLLRTQVVWFSKPVQNQCKSTNAHNHLIIRRLEYTFVTHQKYWKKFSVIKWVSTRKKNVIK